MKAYRQNAGLTRAAAILLVLVLVMLVITIVPFLIRWREENATFNCSLSVEKMQDLLDMEVLFRQRTLTHKETAAFLEYYYSIGEILCPDGGEFDAVERDSLSMEVVCCRHDSNTARRTQLCAERVLDRVRKAVRTEQISGRPFPDSVKITLNSRTVKAVRVEAPTLLRRGTATTPGYKGIVAFYALAGEPEDVDILRIEEAAEEETAGSSETGDRSDLEADSSETDGAAALEAGSTETDGAADLEAGSTETDGGSDLEAGSTETDGGSDLEAGSSETDGVSDLEAGSSETDGGSDLEADSSETGGGVPFLPDGDVEPGEVWYFSFADENHAAGWTVGDGWRLDDLRPTERKGT